MPRYDGTGPEGRGPMTGRGEGYCLLKLPGSPGEPLSGFLGRSGFPVRLRSGEIGLDLGFPRHRVRRLEAELREMRRRIEASGRL